MGERITQLRRKLYRTVVSLAIVIGIVMAVRWTIRMAMTRAYRVERDVSTVDVAVAPAPKVWSLAQILPKELHVNIGGLAVHRHAERLHMPYALAVNVADEKAKCAGWERLDNENAITLKNLSGMERVFKTPEGAVVLREVRAIKGNDSIMEDLTMPVELIPNYGVQTTPDVLARRSAARVKGLLPSVLRDVVVGSPMMTELVERGNGAALIVRCVSEMPIAATVRAIESAARKAGWTETPFVDVDAGKATGRPRSAVTVTGGTRLPSASWSKKNLTFHFEIVSRSASAECDVNYRFTDDESFIPTKGKTNED